MRRLRLLWIMVLSGLVLVLPAQMCVWNNGRIVLETEMEHIDSVTFARQQVEELTFTFEWATPFSLVVIPSRSDVDYIWIATSDDDYGYYGYTSYEEAWQTSVDVASRWGALEEWGMIVRGNDTVDLTDPTFLQGHYVLAVAGWQNGMRCSMLQTYAFTLTDVGGVPDAASVVRHRSGADASVVVMQWWKDGDISEQLLLSGIDSVTFRQPEVEPQFYLSVTDITNISFRATIVPVDEKMLYFADYVPQTVFDSYTDDDFAEAYLAQLLERWKYYYPGQTFADAFLYKGTKTLRFTEGVMGNTDYALVCFAVDTTAYTLAGPLHKRLFTTEPTPKNPDLTFSVTLNGNNNIVTITPSDNTSTYYWGYYGPSEVEKYGTPQEAWKANVAMYGRDYSSHGEDRFSIAMQALEAGVHYLVVGGYDGEQTTTLFVWEFLVTEDMLPF